MRDHGLRALPSDGEQRGDTGAVALERVVPEDFAGERIEAVNIAIGRDDQSIAVEQERDVASLHLVVRPDDLATVAIEGDGVSVEADKHELLEIHGEVSCLGFCGSRRNGIQKPIAAPSPISKSVTGSSSERCEMKKPKLGSLMKG